jgi:predicted nucleic acid-binding Zn ribbon protein
MKCQHCNAEIDNDSKSCPSCGEKIALSNIKWKGNFALSLKGILLSIAIGIWILVLQNIGIIPINQDVRVTNKVDVGGTVSVDNTVDVNLEEVIGHPVDCRTSYT